MAVQLDPLTRIVGVQWNVEVAGFFVLIESNHFLSNNARLLWHKPPPTAGDTPVVSNVDDRGYPTAIDAPAVAFPTTQPMKDFYNFWLASHIEFPIGAPADRSSIDSFLVNVDKFGADPIIAMRLKYSTPSAVNLGTRINAYFFTHGNFQRVTDNQAGPAIRPASGEDDAVFEAEDQLNGHGSSEHPGGATELEIVITRATQTIALIPMFA